MSTMGSVTSPRRISDLDTWTFNKYAMDNKGEFNFSAVQDTISTAQETPFHNRFTTCRCLLFYSENEF